MTNTTTTMAADVLLEAQKFLLASPWSTPRALLEKISAAIDNETAVADALETSALCIHSAHPVTFAACVDAVCVANREAIALAAPAARRAGENGRREALEMTLDALIWASGSEDFGPGGKAHAGWVRLGRPAIGAAIEALGLATAGAK